MIRYVVDQNVTEKGAAISGPGFATKSEAATEALDPVPILLQVDIQEKAQQNSFANYNNYNNYSGIEEPYKNFSGFYRVNRTARGVLRHVSFSQQMCELRKG